MNFSVEILENEFWWGGTSEDGVKMPFDRNTSVKNDFTKVCPNQTMPFYVSSLGRVIWSDSPFKVEISNGKFTLEGKDIILEKLGDNLKEAFIAARKKYFPIDGRHLVRDFFTTPQYNTWIECLYDPTEEHVLKYARDIIDNGFEPGILMIDEGWHGRYGEWTFDPYKFPHPKEMVDKLHSMGFKVMLWVVPYITADGLHFVNNFMRTANNTPETRVGIRMKCDPSKPALFWWWNGASATLDFSKPQDRKFLDDKLQALMRDFNIDGFKFDGGNVTRYAECITGEHTSSDKTPNELNELWNTFAAQYDYHEYKDTYNGAKHATIQRLSDRRHAWAAGDKWGYGLSSIIPNSLAEGIIGHPFICPDMVGGGEWSDFLPGKPLDQELFVRWAQCSALFPMMQYSKAPWNCLDKKHCSLVIEAGKLHKAMSDEIYEMVKRAEISGEPILRNLEYNFPHCGYEKTTDEFMLEDYILVCPVIEKGATSRKVIIPDGEWIESDGTKYKKGEYTIDAPLDKLIWFRKAI